MRDLPDHLKTISKIKERLSSNHGKLIYLVVSGSDLYGFPSEDSDVDYRGAYLVGTNKLLGLKTPRDVIDILTDGNDIVLFEMKKEIQLAIKGNCNVLEHINAKPILSTAEFVRMKQLVNNAFGKNGIYNSYKGMATFNYKKFILQGRTTVKKYLYVFRGLMAGIHVLQTGVIEPDIERLNKYFKFKEVKDLIKLKREGIEKGVIPLDMDIGVIEARINDLFVKIDKAYAKSKIPERPSEDEIGEIDEFLKTIRRDNM